MPRFLRIGCLVMLISANAIGQMSDYRVYFGTTLQRPQQIILRQWQQNRQLRYLTVNPQTLETAIVALPSSNVQPLPWAKLAPQFQKTPYLRAIRAEQQRDQNLQDAGLERADTTERGFSLTIDLCPSNKPLTRSVFEQLIAAFEPEEKPIPITITITGLWMARHAQDLAYLKGLVSRGDLAITWVNHSYYHHYDPRLPLSVNFLLEPNTNLTNEILLNEQAMIKNGLTPSPFFRFPGLVSDKFVFDRVLAFGLLPIGCDAWLAKNQQPKQGSLVLIHANGNEPVGIADFIRLIRQKADSIRNKTWLLYQLPTSIVDTVGK
ncbi:polysaccharide deacetylase family protein [Spirosoma endbachense]|uniref:Polysaccharide deacetylase n=1 Tax=Spirosoma endbachense TaxID=2666025 RepID=A0A6P1VQ55_9BACT|nr:polysaccharide deacetylase [Spirosoma endbachense]QHV94110.1 polysaccharide deacetylase [Spirosoma endbachense]